VCGWLIDVHAERRRRCVDGDINGHAGGHFGAVLASAAASEDRTRICRRKLVGIGCGGSCLGLPLWEMATSTKAKKTTRTGRSIVVPIPIVETPAREVGNWLSITCPPVSARALAYRAHSVQAGRSTRPAQSESHMPGSVWQWSGEPWGLLSSLFMRRTKALEQGRRRHGY